MLLLHTDIYLLWGNSEYTIAFKTGQITKKLYTMTLRFEGFIHRKGYIYNRGKELKSHTYYFRREVMLQQHLITLKSHPYYQIW